MRALFDLIVRANVWFSVDCRWWICVQQGNPVSLERCAYYLYMESNEMRFPSSCWYVLSYSVLSCLLLLPCQVKGDNLTDYYSMRTRGLAQVQAEATRNSRQLAMNGSASSSGSGVGTRKRVRQVALRDYLGQLVPAMGVSAEVKHIPVEQKIPIDVQTPEKKWTKYYVSLKNSLRPEVKYLWQSNANKENSIVVLSQQHIDMLQSNLDVIMWYRNELDLKGTGDEHSGTQSFKIFIDYMIAGILKGLPEVPHVDMDTGLMTVPEWNLDERALRSQLALTYRYLTAKYQTYKEFDQFGPADREFLLALMRTAYLLGAKMEHEWLEDLDVRLNSVTQKSAWKIPMQKALSSLGAKKELAAVEEGEPAAGPSVDQQACIISIPRPKPKAKPKPKPKPAPKPKVEETQKIEIIIRSK